MWNLGQILIILATLTTITAMLAYLPGLKTTARAWLRPARLSVYATLGLLALASGLMLFYILTHRFEFDYVFRYSSRDMPMRYLVSAFWGGQEGTFLLWALFGGMLAVFLRFRAKGWEPPVLFFFLGINLFLQIMMLKRSPFAQLPSTPPDGNGLNPLLQDPWMTIHPPVVFFGFAALGIPAAYAMTALVRESYDRWIRPTLPWTVFGVFSLGAGLLLGGYWAYTILGWGGFWGWDPVENSSLVPWLAAVALLHTQLVQLRRGTLIRTNLVLAVAPLLLLTYSTFLTRSGVLADFSVHAFTDLGINQYLVLFMGVLGGGSLIALAMRFRKIGGTETPTLFFSRDSFLVLGSISYILFGAIVLLGTSAPLITRLATTPSSVQPEFYNTSALPFALVFGLLMGAAPLMAWSVAGGGRYRDLRVPGLVALATVVILAVTGIHGFWVLAVLGSAVFAVVANAMVLTRIVRVSPGSIGGPLTHFGVGLCVVGILVSGVFSTSTTVLLPRGEEVRALDYAFTYTGHRPVEEGKKTAYDVQLRTASGSYGLAPLIYPNTYNNGTMRKPDIQSFLERDVYVAPVELRSDPLGARVKGPEPVEIPKGETRDVQGLEVLLSGFDVNLGGSGDGQIEVFVDAQVDLGGGTLNVRPGLVRRPGAKHFDPVEAPLGNSGWNLVLTHLDSDGGTAWLTLARTPHEALLAEITLKPLIMVLWAGTVLTFLGLLVSFVHRVRQPVLARQVVPPVRTRPAARAVPSLVGGASSREPASAGSN